VAPDHKASSWPSQNPVRSYRRTTSAMIGHYFSTYKDVYFTGDGARRVRMWLTTGSPAG